MNIAQYEALQGLILYELTQDNSKEAERMKYTILAGNIQLYQKLFEEKKEDDIQTIIPRSKEEMDEFVKFLDSPRIMSENI